MKHDYKWLKQRNLDNALKLKHLCAGYLRFEVSLRNENVLKWLRGYSWDDIVKQSDDVFLEVLEIHLSIFFNFSKTVMMSTGEALDILTKKYGQPNAIKLIGYLLIRDGKISNKKAFLQHVSAYNKSRWNKMLREAGIGIDCETQVSLPTIPSKIMVTTCLLA
jgi:hypothetical protein